MFKKRGHSVHKLSSIRELAETLYGHSWTVCSGFAAENLIAVNDATGPDGAQEYAIIRNGEQVESLTVSWYDSVDELHKELQKLNDDPTSGVSFGAIELKPHAEPYCIHCA